MKKYDWSRERLEKAIAESNCWFDCLKRLGIPKEGYNYRTLKGKVALYNLDTSHFDASSAKLLNGAHYKHHLVNRDDRDIFCKDAKIKISSLKKEYIRRILLDDEHCEICGIRDWNGRELTFQIHHKDGNHHNHIVDNLQLLCPNCHSQTDNYSNRKRCQS